jgi:ribulose-5-phosphate 4-epimerase/fuculose-1-phosphate aldolase
MSSVMTSRPPVTDAEWETRCDLAALYHIVHDFGWTDIINTHISAQVPGEPGHFLINRYGDMFDEITASSLVKMNLEGEVLDGSKSFNAAGFTIHSGVYKARPDAMCVLHTHTRAGAAMSMIRDGIRPISQDALYVLGDLAYHEFGVPATQEECDALGISCQKGSSVVLMNHGLLALGPTIPNAFKRLYYMERACEVELLARTLGQEPELIAPDVVEKVTARNARWRAKPDYGVAEFEGLKRVIERKGARFRC